MTSLVTAVVGESGTATGWHHRWWRVSRGVVVVRSCPVVALVVVDVEDLNLHTIYHLVYVLPEDEHCLCSCFASLL